MTLEEYAQQQGIHPEAAAEPEQLDRPKSLLEREQARQRADQQNALAVYKAYQEAIHRAGQLESEILQGLQRGENIAALFLKAIKAYSLAIGNDAAYSIISDTLLTVYGQALHDEAAAAMCADAIRSRLERLQQAAETATDSAERSRIQQAIRAHEKRLADIQN